MTNEKRVEMYRMRLDGASLQEIADTFGCTREWVRQIIPAAGTASSRRSTKAAYERCIYPNIAKWLYESRCSYNRLGGLIGSSSMTVYRWLTGESDPSKRAIDKILEVVEMDYETAFSKDLLKSE